MQMSNPKLYTGYQAEIRKLGFIYLFSAPAWNSLPLNVTSNTVFSLNNQVFPEHTN